MPAPKPQISKKRVYSEDQRITNCTTCRLGIFKGTPYEWVKGKGLIHTKCKVST